MPDPAKLKAGDRVKLLTVLAADLAQRKGELADPEDYDTEMPGELGYGPHSDFHHCRRCTAYARH